MLCVTTPSQQTSVQLIYKECRYGRSDLDRLFAVAPQGIGTASIHVSTQRGSTRYAAGTVDDLIAALTAANVPGVSGLWPNLSLEASDSAGTRRVVVSIDNDRTEVNVSGSDETWVYGQAARVQILLASVGGKESPASPLFTKRDLAKALFFSILLTGAVALADRLWPEHGFYIGVGGIGACLTFSNALSGYYQRKVNRPVLVIDDEVPHGSWWERLSAADKISFGTMIFTALAIVVGAAVGLGQIFTSK
jgi:hypothetical protein